MNSMNCEVQNADIAVAMTSICNEASREIYPIICDIYDSNWYK
jgi:hypothetical protein